MERMSPRARCLLIAFGVAALALAPFLPVIFDGEAVFLFRDLTNVCLPAKATWVRGVLALGRVPLWDPFHGGGRPFLPDLNGGPLYPLNFLLLPFGPDRVARGGVFFIAAHHLLMALGGYGLFRACRCRAAVAAAGALALAWCGFSVGVDNLFPELGGATAMPWFFLFLIRLRSAGRALSVHSAGASLALAWAIYAGNAQVVYIACFVAPLVLWKRSVPLALAQLAGVGVLALLAAAPQLLPTLAYLGRTLREFELASPELRYSYQVAWSLHPARFFELVFPFAFGAASAAPGWGLRFLNVANETLPFILSNYAGAALAAPLLVLFPSRLRRIRRWPARRLALAAAAILLALLALGELSPVPLYRFALSVLPMWDRFRYPERIVFWVSFAWISCATLSLETVLRARLGAKPFLTAAALALAAGVAFRLAVPAGGAGLVHGGIFLALSLALLAVARRVPHAPLLLGALVACDLFLAARHLVWPQSEAFVRLDNLMYVKKVTDDLAKNETFLREGGARRTFTLDRLHGVRHGDGATATAFDFESAGKWSYLLFNTNSYWGVEAATGFFALQIDRTLLDRMLGPDQVRRALDLMSVRYLLTFAPAGNSVSVSRSAVPYASVPAKLRWVRDDEEALTVLRDPAWSYENTAVVEGEPAVSLGAAGGSWRVTDVRKEFDQVTLKLEASPAEPSPGWLLLNETFSSHWTARDSTGSPLRVRRANAWSMALALPPARPGSAETITLSYSEPSYSIGLAGLAIWLAITIWLWRRSHAPERVPA